MYGASEARQAGGATLWETSRHSVGLWTTRSVVYQIHAEGLVVQGYGRLQ